MNAESVKILKEAIIALAGHVDGVAWRVSTSDERHAGVSIQAEIRQILRDLKEA